MQANTRCSLTREFQIKSSGVHFHELYARRPHQLSKISPSIVQSCYAQEGEFGKNAAILVWNYTQDGNSWVAKTKIENLDMEKKTITYRFIEGDLMKSYKTFLVHFHVLPKEGNNTILNWTFEYEKLCDDVPDPISFMELLIQVGKDADNHLSS